MSDTLDGIPVFNPYHVGGMFTAWNPDALATLEVSTSSPSPDLPPSLSGTIAATTRSPGSRHEMQGSLSTDQARLTMHGPIAGGRMPERERHMLLLRAEGYSYREIAGALEINEASVGVFLARAKEAFRGHFEALADASH